MEQEQASWKHEKSRMEKQVLSAPPDVSDAPVARRAEEEQRESGGQQAEVGEAVTLLPLTSPAREKLANEEQKHEFEEDEAKARAGYELVKKIIAGERREGEVGDVVVSSMMMKTSDQLGDDIFAGIESALKENQENERSLYNTLTVKQF